MLSQLVRLVSSRLVSMPRVFKPSIPSKIIPNTSIFSSQPQTDVSLVGGVQNLMAQRWNTRGNTYQPNTLKRKRKHGFLRRLRTINGRKMLRRRMLKGRKHNPSTRKFHKMSSLSSGSVLKANVFDRRALLARKDVQEALERLPPESIPVTQIWPDWIRKPSEYAGYIAVGIGALIVGPIFLLLFIIMEATHFLVSMTGPLSEVMHLPVRLVSEQEDEKLKATYLEPGTPAYVTKARATQRVQERLEREKGKYSAIDAKRTATAAKPLPAPTPVAAPVSPS